jgi:hypothetical protein
VAVSFLPVFNGVEGAAMSLRAELVRLGLRWFVKRKIGPATTLEALRRQDAFLEVVFVGNLRSEILVV